MKRFSLTFFSRDMEYRFQQQILQSNLWVFGLNLLLFGSVAAFISIYSFSQAMFPLAIFALVLVIQIPVFYFLARNSSNRYDYICLIFQISGIMTVPLTQIFDLDKGPIADADTYLIGQTITQVAQSFNIGSRFSLKAITILVNIIIQCFLKYYNNESMTPLTVFWIVSNIMVFQHIYWQERIQREAFLVKHNEILWQSQIGNFAQISIMTNFTEKGQLLLDYDRCNQQCKEQFKIQDINQYKNFLNNVKITSKKYANEATLQNLQSFKKLKSIKTLHQWINIFSEQRQGDHSEFISYYNSQYYDIMIFTTWNDQLLNIHTLMTKSRKQPLDQTSKILQYERKLFSHFREKFQISLKMILIKLKRIGEMRGMRIYNGSVMSNTYDALRQNYNLQLYQNPSYLLKNSHFSLLQLMTKINEVFRHQMPPPYRLEIKCEINSNLQLYSCQKTIFHVMYNLYSMIVVNAIKSGYIKVTTMETKTKLGLIITFRVTSNIKSMELLFEGQNKQTDLFRQSNYMNLDSQADRIGLEINVSEQLIGRIGPFKRIRLIDSYQSQPILSFSIFQDLQIMNI